MESRGALMVETQERPPMSETGPLRGRRLAADVYEVDDLVLSRAANGTWSARRRSGPDQEVVGMVEPPVFVRPTLEAALDAVIEWIDRGRPVAIPRQVGSEGWEIPEEPSDAFAGWGPSKRRDDPRSAATASEVGTLGAAPDRST